MPEKAMTTLFGNLLDNAIEANLRVDKNRRFIKFLIKPIKDNYYILVKNRFCGEIRFADGSLISTKKSKEHGIGTRQIEKVVDEAGGLWTWENENDVFIIKIMIPLREER